MDTYDKSTNPDEANGKHCWIRWVPWVLMAVVTLALTGVILYLTDHFEAQFGTDITLTKPLVSMRAFQAEGAGQTPTDTVESVDIGVEGNPDMVGFLKLDANIKCPESFYAALLKETNKVAAIYGKGITVRNYFRFDGSFAKTYFKDPSTFAGLSSIQIESEQAPRRGDFYSLETNAKDSLWQSKTGESSLAAALSVVERDTPTILLTDFVEPEGELERKRLQTACESLFSQNLTVAVVSMEGSFGGLLYDIDAADKVFSYGLTSNKTVTSIGNPKQINVYHRKIRYFYVVVVGTAKQCETLINGQAATETSAATTGLLTMFKNFAADINYDLCRGNHDAYGEPQVLYFGRNGIRSVLNSVDQKNISATETTGVGTSTQNQPGLDRVAMHAAGVDAYKILKDDEATDQIMSLTYQIKPDVERYSETWQVDQYIMNPVTKQQAVFTGATKAEADQSEQSVHVIGRFYATYTLEPFVGSTTAFTLSPLQKTADGLSFQVDVNTATLKRGIYRLKIPITLLRSKNAGMPDLEAYEWIAERSISRDQMKALRDKDKPGNRTTDLLEHFYQINDAQKIVAKQPVPLANVTIDIEIQ